jgi:multicomponent Na+:H+ antiporter subunit D
VRAIGALRGGVAPRLIRTQTLFFPSGSRPATLILVLAGATMVVGVLGAIAQDDMKRILSFTIISQIGFMVMGLGFFTVAGIAAVVFRSCTTLPGVLLGLWLLAWAT